MSKYKVAGYIRLSKEDKIKDESNSVTNQKAIIDSYVKKNEDLELIEFYIDMDIKVQHLIDQNIKE